MIIGLALLLAAGPRQHLGPPAPAEVRRVVTLAPSLSEIVLALGARDRLVGVTRFDDDPRTEKLPRIGGYNDPQPEAVLAVKPDLVLAEPSPENRGPVETLARLGIPVEAFPLATVANIEDAVAAIAGELLEDAGGENAAGDNALPFFRLSTEAAVRSAPQVIVLCGVEAPAGRRPIPGLNTRVTSLRSTALLHPGPRLPEALADLRAALAR